MMRAALVGAVLFLSAFTSASHAEDFLFETDFARLTISDGARATSLIDKASHQELLNPSRSAAGQSALAFVDVNGRHIAATQLERAGDKYTLIFGTSGIRAEYKISATRSYFVFELVAAHGAEMDQIVFAQFPVKSMKYGSGLLNVKWNEQFAVCLMALDDQVQAGFGPAASLRATSHKEFGIADHKAALIAVPTDHFYDVVQDVERDFHIPHAMLSGHWAKTSQDIRRGYLFVDLTEKNASEMIRLAKLGGFSTILIYSGTWSRSNGSYPINTANYPGGENGLKAVVDQCHAAGLKVGIHVLTSFVAKNDPLVRPRPDPRLLKDAQAVLKADIDAKARDIAAVDALKGFGGEPSYYGERGGLDVQIDDEIIHYDSVGGENASHLLHCTRGANGTRPAAHKAGAPIQHLAQRYNSYLVDLRTSLKDQLADRIAGVINRCGLDMIYFDGGEVNSADGPAWYWVGVQQSAVFSRVKRDLLVQGSGHTQWTWHFYSRGTCDDFAAIAPKEFLDDHKIADAWRSYRSQFMPAELGWWGFLSDAPDHPATSPDEVEFYTTRMLALDSPVSLETTLAALKRNGRAEQLLRLLGEHEKLRLSGTVPPDIREKLRTGEWHWSHDSRGQWQFQPIRYDASDASTPTSITLENHFKQQPLQFRLAVESALAPIGDPANIPLLKTDQPIEIPLPPADAPMPGAMTHRVVFAHAAGDQASALMVAATHEAGGKLSGPSRDLVHHRALAIELEVTGDIGGAGAEPAVLNVQLESEGKRFRDHYIDLNFTGRRTITLRRPSARRMLPEFRPNPKCYSFKLAGYTFNYERIVALNFRWMRLPPGKKFKCTVRLVEALAESDTVLHHPRLTINGHALGIAADLHTGDYAELFDSDSIHIFDANGNQKQELQADDKPLTLAAGGSALKVSTATRTKSSAPIRFTLITLGSPLKLPFATTQP